jgi:erythromycin esterase-like protein
MDAAASPGGKGVSVVLTTTRSARQVDKYVKSGPQGSTETAAAPLAGFQRWPQWMWANTEVSEFVGWLKDWNDSRPSADRVGVYGLDLYSLYRSQTAVLDYLRSTGDAQALRKCAARFECFNNPCFSEDAQAYGQATSLGLAKGCEKEALAVLMELHRERVQGADDELFRARVNALSVVDAESYYRAMFTGRANSWNLRDRHMMATLKAVAAHLTEARHRPFKGVVWAHNSHIGDARSTDMGSLRGELNLGQLMREEFGRDAVYLVGFSTYSGTVTAASNWDGHVERKWVRPALPGSYEELLHAVAVKGLEKEEAAGQLTQAAGQPTQAGQAGGQAPPLKAPRFLLVLNPDDSEASAARNKAIEALMPSRLTRAIGVIYRPDTERWSHYFSATLPSQFDALVHIDHTRALEPLSVTPLWQEGERGREADETFPTGL